MRVIHTCELCGKESEQDNTRLPDGWRNVTIQWDQWTHFCWLLCYSCTPNKKPAFVRLLEKIKSSGAFK